MYQIGVDIGGTSIKIGLVDDELNIVRRTAIPFPMIGGDGVAMELAKAVRGLLAEHGVTEKDMAYVGVVVPGSIDPTGEIVLNAHNLGFHDVPFKKLLEAQFPNHTVYLANDADGAALAELGRGAFMGCKTAVLLTLGTGVGGGVILNGRMFSGGCRRGCELGHMQLVAGGELCTCGVNGCIEAYCSATALIRDGIRAMKAHPESMLAVKSGGDESQLTGKFIIDCAKDGDETAKAVFDAYVDHLGSAVVTMVHILDPEVIAIGGGICHSGEFLFEPLRKNVMEKCFFDSCGDIVPAKMGNDAGIIGAAMLGR